MTTKSFDSFLKTAKESWPADAHVVHEAAAASFRAEMSASEALGEALAEARKARRMSQPQLSQATGIQQAEISRIERGRGNPTVTTIDKLARALDVPWSFGSTVRSAHRAV